MEHLKEKLKVALEKLALDFNEEQVNKTIIFLYEMQKWNKTYNLTAIKDIDQMLIHHVFDSLAIVPYIAKFLNNDDLILDIGSGGGLPGVMLAIAYPNLRITCIDAVEKKVTFVRQMAGVLKLSNLKAEHTRIEARSGELASAAISRAFASLYDFVSLSEAQLNKNKIMFAMKGIYPTEEVEELESKTNWFVDEVVAINVPSLNANRCLLVLKEKR